MDRKVTISNGLEKIVLNIRIESNKNEGRDIDLNPVSDVSRFSVSGILYNGRREICAGQISKDTQDFFKKTFVGEQLDAALKFIELWERWHLNDLQTGCREQIEALKDYLKDNRYDYDKVCDYLKSINLYQVNGYKYGHSWLYEPLPEGFEIEIGNLLDMIEKKV